jgi:hypothetical protein
VVIDQEVLPLNLFDQDDHPLEFNAFEESFQELGDGKRRTINEVNQELINEVQQIGEIGISVRNFLRSYSEPSISNMQD